jgi:hypothetical protein
MLGGSTSPNYLCVGYHCASSVLNLMSRQMLILLAPHNEGRNILRAYHAVSVDAESLLRVKPAINLDSPTIKLWPLILPITVYGVHRLTSDVDPAFLPEYVHHVISRRCYRRVDDMDNVLKLRTVWFSSHVWWLPNLRRIGDFRGAPALYWRHKVGIPSHKQWQP